MSDNNRDLPDTSWMSDETAARVRRVLGAIAVVVLTLWVTDRVFFDGIATQFIRYLLDPPRGP